MIRRLISGTAIATCMLAVPNSALAYDYVTHSQIAQRAVYVMQHSAAALPPPGSPSTFPDFLKAVVAAPSRLQVLRTGLPQGLQQASKVSANDDKPFPIDPSNHFDCPILIGDNLSALDSFRIEDFNYTVDETPDPCGVVFADTSNNDPSAVRDAVLRSVIGWHAGSVDDHLNDVVLWVRPQNAPGIKQINQLAEDAFDVSVGAVFLALSCLASLFGGGDCDPSSAFDAAKDADPVRAVNNALPGLGDIRSSMFTGLWHFEQVAQTNPTHEYNEHRGIWYPGAGPNGTPGAVDVAIADGSMIAGLSLNAAESDGISHFAQYDQKQRTSDDWQGDTLGNIEFSPLHNLAKYGWDLYVKSGFTDAQGLSYPLHALGDATVPQHVAGTTSYGHRPYEDYVNRNLDALLGTVVDDPSKPEASLTAAQIEAEARMLNGAFDFWVALHQTNGDIQSLVIKLAQQTYGMVVADGSWPFQDEQSVLYLDPTPTTVDGVTIIPGGQGSENSIQFYDQFKDFMPKYLELSVSASIGFLAYAAEQAQDPGLDPNSICPGRSEYNITDLRCEDNFPPIVPPTPPVLVDLCVTNGQCGGGGAGAGGGTAAGGGTGGATQCGPEGTCPNCQNNGDTCDLISNCCLSGVK
ncbi:MAG TPA: hypothetical protein VK745_23315 [Polyangiaceae bacterium]|nr:hypothetical protein [Polyangiaceae bacterium]